MSALFSTLRYEMRSQKKKARLHIPCLLRPYTYSLGRALYIGETADHCFCNQTCNLHEEADAGLSKDSRLSRLGEALRHDGVGVGVGRKREKAVILASTYTYPILFRAKRMARCASYQYLFLCIKIPFRCKHGWQARARPRRRRRLERVLHGFFFVVVRG